MRENSLLTLQYTYIVKSCLYHTALRCKVLLFFYSLALSLTGERRCGGLSATRPAAEETEESLKNTQPIWTLGLSATVQLVKVGQALSGIAGLQIRLTAKCYGTATYA